MSAGQSIPYAQEVRRKLIHLSSLWIVVVILLGNRWILSGIFLGMLLLNLLWEGGYARRWPGFYASYQFCFGRMLRQEPSSKAWVVSGSPYVLAAAALVCVLYPNAAAAGAIAVMLLADTAAALIGRKFGRIKIWNGKSLEGTLAFVLVGAGVVLAGWGMQAYSLWQVWSGLAGVVLAAAAELFEKQLHVDDNFSIPLLVGLGLSLPLLA